MKVECSAPTRIDLAGGTLDIFPLYFLHEFGLTLNLALTKRTRAMIETRDDNQIVICSKDLNKTITFASLKELHNNHDLSLVSETIRHFNPPMGITVTVASEVPKGSGLGASSSLLVSLVAAFNQLLELKLPPEKLLTIAQGIETYLLQVPTGRQDYYAVLYGGLNAIWFTREGEKIEQLTISPSLKKYLQDSVILCFIGESHQSGAPNWDIVKARIEQHSQTIRALEEIKHIALQMRSSILNSDFQAIGELLVQEYAWRKKLSPFVETTKMKNLIHIAQNHHFNAWKVCGAGGGGSMVFLGPPEHKKELIAELAKNGAQILEFLIDERGVSVSHS